MRDHFVWGILLWPRRAECPPAGLETESDLYRWQEERGGGLWFRRGVTVAAWFSIAAVIGCAVLPFFV